jgi:hypothetical protein
MWSQYQRSPGGKRTFCVDSAGAQRALCGVPTSLSTRRIAAAEAGGGRPFRRVRERRRVTPPRSRRAGVSSRRSLRIAARRTPSPNQENKNRFFQEILPYRCCSPPSPDKNISPYPPYRKHLFGTTREVRIYGFRLEFETVHERVPTRPEINTGRKAHIRAGIGAASIKKAPGGERSHAGARARPPPGFVRFGYYMSSERQYDRRLSGSTGCQKGEPQMCRREVPERKTGNNSANCILFLPAGGFVYSIDERSYAKRSVRRCSFPNGWTILSRHFSCRADEGAAAQRGGGDRFKRRHAQHPAAQHIMDALIESARNRATTSTRLGDTEGQRARRLVWEAVRRGDRRRGGDLAPGLPRTDWRSGAGRNTPATWYWCRTGISHFQRRAHTRGAELYRMPQREENGYSSTCGRSGERREAGRY